MKKSKHALMLLAVMLTVLIIPTMNAFAQTDNAIVVVLDSIGGTSDPVPGTYNYPNGSIIRLRAIPDDGFEFKYWVISGSYQVPHNQPPAYLPPEVTDDGTSPLVPSLPSPAIQDIDSLIARQNPLNIICGYGYTFRYQPVFAPTTPTTSAEAIVNILPAAGGTSSPSQGTYTYPGDAIITLEATANDGFEFLYWIATTTDVTGHDTLIADNPTSIDCQAGYTYSYQPVFKPTGATTADVGIPAEYLYAIIIILVIIVVIGIGAALMYRGQIKGK